MRALRDADAVHRQMRISPFPDGSERHTLASYTEGIGDVEPFPINFGWSDEALDELKQHCEDKDFTRALKNFRERVSKDHWRFLSSPPEDRKYEKNLC